ncbi:lysophospholipid acyltransferase family protein [Candidatus Omnitrophota bacterium]
MKYRFRRRLLYTVLVFLDGIFLLIPYEVALGIGRFFGYMLFLLLGRYRRLCKDHLRLAFGDSKSSKEISDIVKSVFLNLSMSFTEILSLPKMKKRLTSIIDIKGLDKVDKVLSEGKGAIVVSAHLGSWELLPMYFAQRGYSANVVARPIYYEKYDEWVLFLRKSMGVNVIYRTKSPKKIFTLLKANKLVGILPDQDVDSVDGIFVDFFGRKTYTPSAPTKLAMSSKAPIIPIFIVREGKGHTIYVDEPIRVDGDRSDEQEVLAYTQQWSNVLESYIRRYPGQWVWMHRRWKTTPSTRGNEKDKK